MITSPHDHTGKTTTLHDQRRTRPYIIPHDHHSHSTLHDHTCTTTTYDHDLARPHMHHHYHTCDHDLTRPHMHHHFHTTTTAVPHRPPHTVKPANQPANLRGVERITGHAHRSSVVIQGPQPDHLITRTYPSSPFNCLEPWFSGPFEDSDTIGFLALLLIPGCVIS